MHDIQEMVFRRRFCVNPYKTLRLPLGGMDCCKDWLHTDRGDPYPLVCVSPDAVLEEQIRDAAYRVRNIGNSEAFLVRLLGQFFPYASYEFTADQLSGSVGLYIACEEGCDFQKDRLPSIYLTIRHTGDGRWEIRKKILLGGKEQDAGTVGTPFEAPGLRSFMITARGISFDLYWCDSRRPYSLGTVSFPELTGILKYRNFSRTIAGLAVILSPDESFQGKADFFLDGGISHADMKCMRYENGMPIMHEGKLFMTMSSRMEAGGYQSVISWNPSTSDFHLEGALFFDVGDDAWCSDVASSVIYDRRVRKWYVWACSFSHGHILCHSECEADLRWGIHVLDAQLMETQEVHSDSPDSLGKEAGGVETFQATLSEDTLFYAKTGDEDPDLIWDEKRGKWLLAIDRLTLEDGENKYRYFLFESDQPFTGFRCIGQVREGNTTGGSMIRVNGKMYLCCGSRFDRKSLYQVHPADDPGQCYYLKAVYPDGGFRGWGTIIPVPCGSRTRYLWMTFDRHCGSDYNWSYGNIYVYESDLMASRWEWDHAFQDLS